MRSGEIRSAIMDSCVGVLNSETNKLAGQILFVGMNKRLKRNPFTLSSSSHVHFSDRSKDCSHFEILPVEKIQQSLSTCFKKVPTIPVCFDFINPVRLKFQDSILK